MKGENMKKNPKNPVEEKSKIDYGDKSPDPQKLESRRGFLKKFGHTSIVIAGIGFAGNLLVSSTSACPPGPTCNDDDCTSATYTCPTDADVCSGTDFVCTNNNVCPTNVIQCNNDNQCGNEVECNLRFECPGTNVCHQMNDCQLSFVCQSGNTCHQTDNCEQVVYD